MLTSYFRPKIIPAKVLEAQAAARSDGFKLLEAVPDATVDVDDMDPEMANFMPMLQNYLQVNDIKPRQTSPAPKDDEYVWDVFYHRPTPMSLDEWNALAMNMATVYVYPVFSGLKVSVRLTWMCFRSGYTAPGEGSDSDDDSEVEDEADEDSNGPSPLPSSPWPSLPIYHIPQLRISTPMTTLTRKNLSTLDQVTSSTRIPALNPTSM